jgi:ankyrin repeat protein
MVACESGHVDVASVLIDKGADIHGFDEENKTALWHAANNGHLNVVKWLIAKGFVHINAKDKKFGENALLRACQNEHWDIVAFFLRACKKNIDYESADFDGVTPLMYTAEFGKPNLLKQLIDLGADIHARDQDKESAILLASEHGHPTCIDFLIKAGASLNDTCKYGEDVCQRAHRAGSADRLKASVDHHAENITN